MFSQCVTALSVETNRSSYQIQELIENGEEVLAIEKDDYTSSVSSSCSDEHNMWNPFLELFLSRAEWLARGGAGGRSCHSQGCTLMPFFCT